MKNVPHSHKTIRSIIWIAAELLAVGTAIRLLPGGVSERLLLSLITPFLLLIPAGSERLLHCRLALPVYVFTLLYALGPMLGHCWMLYHLTNWWDKCLHIAGGILFALVGWELYRRWSNSTHTQLFAALFALCFSITIAVFWEFFEFGADQLLGMDMQNDTIVYSFPSYFLGNTLGALGRIDAIEQVVIDGVPLPFAGYLEIGLQDTMWDMILESLGALVTAGFCFFTNGKYPGLQYENYHSK